GRPAGTGRPRPGRRSRAAARQGPCASWAHLEGWPGGGRSLPPRAAGSGGRARRRRPASPASPPGALPYAAARAGVSGRLGNDRNPPGDLGAGVDQPDEVHARLETQALAEVELVGPDTLDGPPSQLAPGQVVERQLGRLVVGQGEA